MTNEAKAADRAKELEANVEESCETWDWARTAGLSLDELKKALEQARNAPA